MTSSAELWQRFCQYRIVRPELGFSLDVSRVQFSDADLTGLRTKMSTALDAMTRLERGAIANADENRMVGHYWLRAPQLAPTAELTNAIEAAIHDVNDFVSKVHLGQIAGAEGPFTHVLHVGIGGSALGPQLVAQALGSTSDRLTILFVDNTDPDGIDSVLAQLEGKLGRTLVTVVSKSGGTPETRNGTLEIEAAYTKAGLSFAQHAIAITQEGSKLDQTAVNDGWIARFPMWDWVGGRTSVLSTVGLVPAALQGIDTSALLRGAALMDQATREVDPYQNPGAMLAMMWYHCTGGRGLKDMVLLPYKDRLSLLSRYLQQLVMESLGKEFDRAGNAVYQGIAVYGNKGSTDQHAYVQQLRDGVPNFFVTFVQVLCDRAGTSIEVDPQITSGDYLQGFLLGTRSALYEKSRDSITITIEQITPETVGALIALYERAVGLYAELIDVNAYHQPGVEAGKKAAAVVLDLQRKVLESLPAPGQPATAGELAALLGQPDQVETIFKILEHLALNPSRGVQMVVDASPALTRFSRG